MTNFNTFPWRFHQCRWSKKQTNYRVIIFSTKNATDQSQLSVS